MPEEIVYVRINPPYICLKNSGDKGEYVLTNRKNCRHEFMLVHWRDLKEK